MKTHLETPMRRILCEKYIRSEHAQAQNSTVILECVTCLQCLARVNADRKRAAKIAPKMVAAMAAMYEAGVETGKLLK